MPRLVSIRTGEVVIDRWYGPPPGGFRAEPDPPLIPPPPENVVWDEASQLWNIVDTPEPVVTVSPGTSSSAFVDVGSLSRDGFLRRDGLDALAPPPATPRRSAYQAVRDQIEEEMPRERSSYRQFEQLLGNIHGRTGFQEDKYQTFIGLELENEALKEVDWPRVSGWNFHLEGSLRGHGFEYVQHSPAQIPVTFTLLDNLIKVINTKIGKVTNSIRTSTHVHFDCTKYNFLDIINFSCLYWMLESFLSHYCGESRKGNLFCLRLKDASAGQILLQQAIKNGSPHSVPLIRNDYRYSSLNFSSIAKFGSLEFRMLRGTNDFDTIVNWVNALEAIKQYALKFKTPLELRDHFIKDIEARDLPRAVLGKELSSVYEKCLPKGLSINGEVREGFLAVSGILNAHKTWDFTEEIKKEKEKQLQEMKEFEAFDRDRARARDAARAPLQTDRPINITGDAGPDEAPDQGIDGVVFRDYTDE